MTTEQLANENDTTVSIGKVITETTGLTRQRLVPFTVTNINPKNPVVAFTPGQVGLTRIDAALVIPKGHFVEAYWNGNKQSPEVIVDSYPEGGSFEFQLMVWGTQGGRAI